jgi:hypothetical protein
MELRGNCLITVSNLDGISPVKSYPLFDREWGKTTNYVWKVWGTNSHIAFHKTLRVFMLIRNEDWRKLCYANGYVIRQ